MSDFKKRMVRYFKGAGAGSMLISIVVHLIIISGATVWVVSSVQPQRKAAFQGGGNEGAPTVQHAVKMSNTQPNLDTMSKRLTVDSPNSSIALPDLPSDSVGVGGPSPSTGATGLGGPGAGGAGGLKGPIMPMFGFKDAQSGGSLLGRFYDFKQLHSRKPNPDFITLGGGGLAAKEVSEFIKKGWSTSYLSKFYRAPKALYATQIFVPVMPADEAPKAYEVENVVQPRAWLAYYRGRVSPPVSGVFRFSGIGDDHLAVRLDGRLVLDGSGRKVTDFQTDRPALPAYPYSYTGSAWAVSTRGGFTVGKRMELKAGQFYDIDIAFSEGPGGLFCAMLLFEQEGVTYEKDAKGNPILPIFRVAPSVTPKMAGAPAFMADGPIWRALPAPKDT